MSKVNQIFTIKVMAVFSKKKLYIAKGVQILSFHRRELEIMCYELGITCLKDTELPIIIIILI